MLSHIVSIHLCICVPDGGLRKLILHKGASRVVSGESVGIKISSVREHLNTANAWLDHEEG